MEINMLRFLFQCYHLSNICRNTSNVRPLYDFYDPNEIKQFWLVLTSVMLSGDANEVAQIVKCR